MFIGCSSDDENDAANANDLVGYWIRYYEGDDMEELGFFADGTCNYMISENDGLDGGLGKGTYVIKGNKLIMNMTFEGEAETWEFTIVSLTSKKKLVLENEDGDVASFDFLK